MSDSNQSGVSVDPNGDDELAIHIGSEPIFVSYAQAHALLRQLQALLGEKPCFRCSTCMHTDYTKGQWADEAGR